MKVAKASEVRRTDERAALLTVLTDAIEPMNPRDIAIEADMKRNNVDRLMGKMAKTGEMLKGERGLYVYPSRSDLLTDAQIHTPGTKLTTSILADLARRVERLAPHHRLPKRFHEDKSEIVAELRHLAIEARRAGERDGP